MDSNNTINRELATHGFYAPNDEQVVSLQSILQRESNVAISISEAKEIGIQLMSLYECLARDRKVASETKGHGQVQ